MNIVLLGAAGFIGTNLAIALSSDCNNHITVVDKNEVFFRNIKVLSLPNVKCLARPIEVDSNFDSIVSGNDIVYHLVSTTSPATSNQHIAEELTENVILSAKMIEACINRNVKKIVFVSSGGTVYGKTIECPINEDAPTYPISSYGLQKVSIEKLLYLYNYMYGIDYRIIRLANPYGPYQRPNGVLGAVNTFIYKALRDESIDVYGNGDVVRDYIYIDDAIYGIGQIVDGNTQFRTFNLGSGKGTSIREVLSTIQNIINTEIRIRYLPSRGVDVPVNYLDISRFEKEFGKLSLITLEEGIKRTAEFMRNHYDLNR